MKEYHKLVRDRIPEIIRQTGSTPLTHLATEEEYRIKLYEKLGEEAKEISQAPSIEEAADLLEVFLAICKLEGWSLDEIAKVQAAKKKQRGAFAKRIILESVF